MSPLLLSGRCTVLVSIVTAVLLAMMVPAAASAQQAASVAPVSATATGTAAAEIQEMRAQFIRIEPATFGMKLTKNGEKIGPSLLRVIPTEAVAGSEEAVRHLGHARILHGFTAAFAASAIGLLVTGVAVRPEEGSCRTSNVLLSGAFVSVLLELAFASGRDHEMHTAVNAYNWDVLGARLPPSTP